MVPGRRGTTSTATKDDFITYYIVYILLYYFTTMAVLFYLSFFPFRVRLCVILLLYTRALCRPKPQREPRVQISDRRQAYIIQVQVFCKLLLKNNDIFDSLLAPSSSRIDFKILDNPSSHILFRYAWINRRIKTHEIDQDFTIVVISGRAKPRVLARVRYGIYYIVQLQIYQHEACYCMQSTGHFGIVTHVILTENTNFVYFFVTIMLQVC